MPNVSKGKLKTLYILEALYERTDEDHRLGTAELIKMLAEKEIKAERKSIYDDIETLKEFGIDILYEKEEPAGYYLASRDFELPELKLLVDAVQSSKFITLKKTGSLISKLEKLAGPYQAKKLQRQVYVSKRIKAMNESIYYNVDSIHEAIQENMKISFEYLRWNLDKELVPKGDERVTVSPWSLTWDDENYYMLAYDEKAEAVKHYRVDKMRKITLTYEAREGRKAFKDFDVAEFAKRTFGMFGGVDEKVTLECDNELIGAILDRFGTDVIIVPSGEDRFKVTHQVTVSGQFYGWIVGLGPGVRITYPEHVAEEFRNRLKQMI